MQNKTRVELFEFKVASTVSEEDFLKAAKAFFRVLKVNNIAQMELYKAADDEWATMTRYHDTTKAGEYWGGILQNMPEFRNYLAMIDSGSAKALFLEKMI